MRMTAIFLVRVFLAPVFLALATCLGAAAQHPIPYNLADLLKNNAIDTVAGSGLAVFPGDPPGAISAVNNVWFRNITFREGTIDLDLRGKNEFLKSFLGILFHGTDTGHFDVLYFRPFNFRHSDTARRRWSVQYMAIPKHDYAVLRKAHPLVYENAVTPVPDPDDWFHFRMTIKAGMLTVWVDHSATPSLQVHLLADNDGQQFGLMSDGLRSDFRNLVITK
jgi:hypothetical protein